MAHEGGGSPPAPRQAAHATALGFLAHALTRALHARSFAAAARAHRSDACASTPRAHRTHLVKGKLVACRRGERVHRAHQQRRRHRRRGPCALSATLVLSAVIAEPGAFQDGRACRARWATGPRGQTLGESSTCSLVQRLVMPEGSSSLPLDATGPFICYNRPHIHTRTHRTHRHHASSTARRVAASVRFTPLRWLRVRVLDRTLATSAGKL